MLTPEMHEKRTLSLEETQGYAREAGRKVDEPLPVMDARSWRCVDGRYDEGDSYAGPGAALGAVLALYAGLERVAQANGGQVPSTEQVYAMSEEALGGSLSGHTDDHQADDAWPCAGCGHCAGALRAPENFGITASADGIRQAVEADDKMRITKLTGEHQEAAVLLLGNNVQMPGRQGDKSAFVFHAEAWNQLLAGLAEAAADKFGVDREQLLAAVNEAAAKQLQITLDKLAKGLPMFSVVVDEDGEIAVRTM